MLNIISIVVTSISIICTIISIMYAKQTKKYKDGVYNILHFHGIAEQFRITSEVFNEKTRDSDWYKGKDPIVVISPFSKVIHDIYKMFSLIHVSDAFQKNIDKLDENVQQFEKLNDRERKDVRQLIREVLKELYKYSLSQNEL